MGVDAEAGLDSGSDVMFLGEIAGNHGKCKQISVARLRGFEQSAVGGFASRIHFVAARLEGEDDGGRLEQVFDTVVRCLA